MECALPMCHTFTFIVALCGLLVVEQRPNLKSSKFRSLKLSSFPRHTYCLHEHLLGKSCTVTSTLHVVAINSVPCIKLAKQNYTECHNDAAQYWFVKHVTLM